jgi:two-component SAPR family response regulator
MYIMQLVDGESTSHKSILVVDDDYDIVSILKLGLEKYSALDVDGFTHPALALEHFERNVKNYDLVISDIRMPQMNGFEFVKKIRAIKPEVKVFLMTAFQINDAEFSRVLPSTRIDEFIQKPISLAKLNALVLDHRIATKKA